MRTLTTMTRWTRRLLCDRRAVAAVEFALILPVMLTAYLGTVDAGHGISADRKLAAATAILGDLSSQANTTLAAETLDTYFEAAEAAMRPFSGDATAQRLTIVSVSGSSATVSDSRVHNGAEALAAGDEISVPDDVLAVARDDTLVVAEGWYTYQPVIGYVFKTPLTLSKREFFVPRYDGGLTIAGSGSGSGSGGSGGSGPSGGGAGGGDGYSDGGFGDGTDPGEDGSGDDGSGGGSSGDDSGGSGSGSGGSGSGPSGGGSGGGGNWWDNWNWDWNWRWRW